MIARADISSAISVDEVGVRTGRMGPFTIKTTLQPVYRRLDNELRLAALIGGTRFLIAGREAGASAIEQLPADQREGAAEIGRALAVRNRGNVGTEGLPLIIGASGSAEPAGAAVRTILAACEAEGPFGDMEPARLICELRSTDRSSLDDLAGIADNCRRSGVGVSIGGFAGSQSDIEAVRAAGPEMVTIESQWFGRVAQMAEAARLLPVLFDNLRDCGAIVHVGALNDGAQLVAAAAAGADLVSGLALAPPGLAGAAIGPAVLSLDQAVPVSGNVFPLFGESRNGH